MATQVPNTDDETHNPEIETWRSRDNNLHVNCGNHHLYDPEDANRDAILYVNGKGDSGAEASLFFSSVTESTKGIKLKRDETTTTILDDDEYPDALFKYLRLNF